MSTYRYRPGRTPLLISIPHGGTKLPAEVAASMTPEALNLPDTDWHVEHLYGFADEIGASVIAASQSRYVVDLNRPPDNKALYPGVRGTDLVPTTTFADQPIYLPGKEPNGREVQARVETDWLPYHARVAQELVWLHDRFGVAVLWDAHSICSTVPRLFQGRLPDFNLGTNNQLTADPALGRSLLAIVQGTKQYSAVLNGRFKGGYITRHYGRPASGVHAIQLELSQATYMDESHPYTFRPDLAARVAPILRAMLLFLIDWTRKSSVGTRFAG
ncbi:MAG: N-formylglutamate deformylase [Alphaproteobacteria bacterium]|nr:N-formylglutamate deformylase [Alphaproteobacteria bacterium]